MRERKGSRRKEEEGKIGKKEKKGTKKTKKINERN